MHGCGQGYVYGSFPCYVGCARCGMSVALSTLGISLLQHYMLALRVKAAAARHQASNQKLLPDLDQRVHIHGSLAFMLRMSSLPYAEKHYCYNLHDCIKYAIEFAGWMGCCCQGSNMA